MRQVTTQSGLSCLPAYSLLGAWLRHSLVAVALAVRLVLVSFAAGPLVDVAAADWGFVVEVAGFVAAE
jgi:hypothetical protein